MLWPLILAMALITTLLFGLAIRRQTANADSKSRMGLLLTAILIPASALGTYLIRGPHDEVALATMLEAQNQSVGEEQRSMAETVEFVRKLEGVAHSNPDRAEYWFMLGNYRMGLESYEPAVDAYLKAGTLYPLDTGISAKIAEAQYLADNLRLTDRVRQQIDTVLEADPHNLIVLSILANAAFQAKQYQAAISFWQRALIALPEGSPTAQSVQTNIEQMQRVAGVHNSAVSQSGDIATSTADASATEATDDVESGPSLDVLVSLGEGVVAEPGTTVFVLARQYQGPPMPVVVERLSAAQLPARLRMDDSKVMVRGRSLADFDQLELVARLSYTGSPAAQSGDYQVLYGPVNAEQATDVIELIIDQPVP